MPNFISPIGAKSIMAMGLQPDYDTPVIGEDVLEYRQGQFDGQYEKLYSEANHDTPSPRLKVSSGNFMSSGDVTNEITPRRAMPRILTNIFGAPTETIASPDTLAAPTVALVGTHTTATTVRKYYVVQRLGSGIPSIPSPAATISTAAILSAGVSVTVTWVAANTNPNDVTTAGGFGVVATYDVLRSTGAGTTIADAVFVGSTAAGTVTFSDTGAIATPYNYVSVPVSLKEWHHGWDRRFSTIIQKKGDAIFGFSSVALHGLSINVSRTQNSLLLAQVKGKAARMTTFCDTGSSDGFRTTQMALTGLSAALYDNLTAFTPSLCLVKIGDVGGNLIAAANAEDFALNFDRNTADEFSLNGKPGPSGFRDSVSALDATFTSKFNAGSEADLKRFMGQSSDTSSEAAYGFGPGVKVVTVDIQFQYPSGYGFNSAMEIIIPRAAYGSLGVPVTGRANEIKQQIRVEPIYDCTATTDLIFRMLSAETAARIVTPTSTPLAFPDDVLSIGG